jgi:hypothetical protein
MGRSANLTVTAMRLYRTSGASEYLRDRYGINRAASYLQKLRVVGGGPDSDASGRATWLTRRPLDAWARSLISKPMRSTSEAV